MAVNPQETAVYIDIGHVRCGGGPKCDVWNNVACTTAHNSRTSEQEDVILGNAATVAAATSEIGDCSMTPVYNNTVFSDLATSHHTHDLAIFNRLFLADV